MWGNVVLETIFNGNYVFGFLTNRSNVLLHLTHWQYWFWFWFTWFLGLYYLVFLNFFLKRPFKAYPKINTSFRSHGKWGDLIVCVVPISWCLNILTNSNFILRLVEWQSESNVFTLRVRAKQWYWVYKIDILNLLNTRNVVKNVGHQSWCSFDASSPIFFHDIIRLQSKFDLQKTFWSEGFKKLSLSKHTSNFHPNSRTEGLRTLNSQFNWPLSTGATPKSLSYYGGYYGVTLSNDNLNVLQDLNKNQLIFFKNLSINQYDNSEPSFKKPINRVFFRVDPTGSIYQNNNEFLKKNWTNPYLIIKQKRFSYKSANSAVLSYKNPELGLFFSKFSNNFWTNFIYNKRLLRTTKLLVLPTNVNISVITNSFDVIHSWFIPGIGFKLDCVPGRSTHHTLHLINPGFYYGQCAEICGRYHHHMPIRICALSFNHFLFWWNNKGFAQFIQHKDGVYTV